MKNDQWPPSPWHQKTFVPTPAGWCRTIPIYYPSDKLCVNIKLRNKNLWTVRYALSVGFMRKASLNRLIAIKLFFVVCQQMTNRVFNLFQLTAASAPYFFQYFFYLFIIIFVWLLLIKRKDKKYCIIYILKILNRTNKRITIYFMLKFYYF